MTSAAGRKAKPVYLVTIANPKANDDVISKGKVCLTIYKDRRSIQAREKAMKSGSDQAYECISMNDADEKKNKIASVVVMSFRPEVIYTVSENNVTFTPNRIAFKSRAA